MNLIGSVTYKEARKTPFGKAVPGTKDIWDRFGECAAFEREIMVEEFHTWAIARRHEIETCVMSKKQHMENCAPFARAGLDGADTPADVPLSVIEFAMEALEVMEEQEKLELLNAYYKRCAIPQSDDTLSADGSGNEQVNQLWEMFLGERSEGSK